MKKLRSPIGLRTTKTAAAVVISMLIVDLYGATPSKLFFAMLGAMAAVQPTFKDSLESCLAQLVGLLLGAAAGILLLMFPISSITATAIGIVLVITIYNTLGIHYPPSIPCFLVVTLCTATDIEPVSYILGRTWDTAIGLGVGMIINTLIFPYDNSRQIRNIVESLNRDVIHFLEDLFDGDALIPDAQDMTEKMNNMGRQILIFSNQKFLIHPKLQKHKLEQFRDCEVKARVLLARLEVLSRMGIPGRLNDENRKRLESCGAQIRDMRPLDSVTERDVVTNYHVNQILTLRRELLDIFQK